MAESATSSDPFCTNTGRAIKLKVDRDLSLFEHPGVVENVIAYLGMWDVLSLGSCSKYLNGVCESDCTWKLLYKRRWGQPATGKSSEDAQILHVNRKGHTRNCSGYIMRKLE